MNQIITVLINHTSACSKARQLLEDLLKILPKDSTTIREQLEACLPELKVKEVAEEKWQAELRMEQVQRAHEEEHFKFKHGREWDPRDDPDWRPY
ncbi:MAG: hypothetical protein WC250_03875 [Candidatus Paceibacterota bacterium]|jgi:hypothetical protein